MIKRPEQDADDLASKELYARAPGPKELFIVEGVGHMDMYDSEGVGTAVSKLAPFFTSHLKPASSAAKADRAAA